MRVRVPLLLLLLAAAPWSAEAQAPDPFLDMLLGERGRRVSATAVDEDYGDAVGAALGLAVVSIDGLDHPAEHRPHAGEYVDGEGLAVYFKDLEVSRLRFPSAWAAKQYAEDSGFTRIDERDPLFVTHVSGKDASQALLDAAVGAALGDGFTQELGARLGRVETSRGGLTVGVSVPNNRPAFSGVVVWLAKKLMVVRLRFDASGVARTFLERDVKTDTPLRMVGDQRGTHLVLLRGRPLEDVQLAKKVLRAGWAPWREDPGKRHTIAVFAPTNFDGQMNYVAYTTENGDLYQAGATMIRRARENLKNSRGGAGGIEWTFLDPESKNHVVFRTKEFYGGAVVRPESMFVAISPTKQRCAEERAYFAELLRGIDFALPPKSKKGMLRLLDPPGK